MTDVQRATQLHELTASEAAGLIRQRSVSPVEMVEHLLRRAERIEPVVKAWETLDPERALAAAREAERSEAHGPLHGVPFGAKDIYDTAGLRTSAGFQPYADRVPTSDSDPVARLKHAGAILLGKMVTTQFAYADPSATRNPWSPERTPGGSSSGSAAGVAAREVPLALGSQTAGSILRPAAYNGAVGFKPTYGRISARGVFPLAWSLDHVGVLTRSVADCALFLAVVADPPAQSIVLDPRPPRLGIVSEALEFATPRLRDHLDEMRKLLVSAGAKVKEVSLGEPLDLILSVHRTIMQTETAAAHWQLLEKYPGMHAPRLRAYAEVGRLIPGVAYLHAQRLRRRIRAAIAHSLSEVDALLLPTAVDVAPTLETTGDPSLQAPFSLVGFPSISLPSGVLQPDGLPLAIQLVAPAWQETRLLSVATWCEAQLPPMPAPPLPK